MKVKVLVAGPFPVAGKKSGSKVELDDDEVNIAALEAAGLIKLLPTRKATP